MVLTFITAILLVLPPLSNWLWPKGAVVDDADRRLLDSLETALEESIIFKPEKTEEPARLFSFDPNTATLEDLKNLGLAEWLGRRIINYRNAGGAFEIKKDLLKIYGFTPREYERIENYIDLPERLVPEQPIKASAATTTPRQPAAESAFHEPKMLFDINKADTAELKKIYGIGDALSERIVKYRNLLGGFVDKAQYAEVYGLEDSVISKLESASYIAGDYQAQKINVNFAGPKTLARHPYISYSFADDIARYRAANGPFADEEALKEAALLPDSVFYKIAPYLTY